MEMVGVREYYEGYPVELDTEQPANDNTLTEPREVIITLNEGQFNGTAIDLLDLIAWLKINRPELFQENQ